MQTNPLVTGRALRMAFGGVEVVKGVDVELLAGEVHAIVGENGAGKSTVAKILAGVHRPTGGLVEVGGQETLLEGPRQALALGIALIHQEPLTFPDLTVAENIFVGHQPLKGRLVDWRKMESRADELLSTLGARFRSRDLAGGLSVADQQMIELASALTHNVKVLLMDETTAALTPKEVAELFEIVGRLRADGCAIAFVSHRLGEVFEISDCITVMRDGEKVGERRPAETEVGEIVRMMIGREITVPPSSERAPDSVTRTESPTFAVKSLASKGRFEEVSFEVHSGEVVALAGLVGAGRTEVCESIFGVRPMTGVVELDGKTVQIRSPREAIALGLAMVPEDRQHDGLLLPMSLAHNATLATVQSTARTGWLADKQERSSAKDYLERLHTAYRSLDQKAKELSGGNQQKIVLAKWLMAAPKVLILDEPTRGVDVGAKEEVHRLVRDLAAQGMAILMVSSDLSEVLAMGHRVLVMREGRLVAEMSQAEATAEKVMLAATGQVSSAA